MKCICLTFKAAPYTWFQELDFYVVASLGSLLVLHVLYMSANEMHILRLGCSKHFVSDIRFLRCGVSRVLTGPTCIVHVCNLNAYILC